MQTLACGRICRQPSRTAAVGSEDRSDSGVTTDSVATVTSGEYPRSASGQRCGRDRSSREATAATSVQSRRPPQSIDGSVGASHPSRGQDAPFPDIPSEFPTVFDGHIRVMPGEEFKIHLTEDAVPFCVSSPRRVPLSLREPLKE